jgi:ribosomal protein S18 acetylase RimI-like enzyme
MLSPITLRPATPEDSAAVAALLVQLYAAEIPGALSGPLPAQRALLRYTLQAENYAGLRGRYVAEDSSGSIVGAAGVRLPSEPSVQRAPAGTIRMAYTLLGYANATRMVGTLARSLVAHAPPLPAGHAYVHGVVVDQEQRGRGLGLAIMQRLEDQLRDTGLAGVQLQVIIDNTSARRLYERLGYRVVGRSPRWLDRLTFPTNTMAKALQIAHA